MKEILTPNQWTKIESLFELTKDIEEKAEKVNLKYIFSVEVGIYPAKVYSCLYKKTPCGADYDVAKFHEYNFFDHEDDFLKHLAEVNHLLNGAYNEQMAYEAELAELNKRYGK